MACSSGGFEMISHPAAHGSTYDLQWGDHTSIHFVVDQAFVHGLKNHQTLVLVKKKNINKRIVKGQSSKQWSGNQKEKKT